MPDFPNTGGLELNAGVFSTASSLASLHNTAFASTAWPSANLAIFVPIRVPRPVTIYKMVAGAGGTAGTNNFDIGIYDRYGTRLVSSGAITKGSSVEHIFNITDTRIGPGLYYLAMSADGTGNYILMTPSGTTPVPVQKARLMGTLEMATAYTLPATATMVARTVAAIPAIAAYTRDY